MSSFCNAKAIHIFSAKNIRILYIFLAKNIRILYIESAKTVNEMTLNELVKLNISGKIFTIFNERAFGTS